MLYKFNIAHNIIIRHLNQKTLFIENILLQIYFFLLSCHSHASFVIPTLLFVVPAPHSVIPTKVGIHPFLLFLFSKNLQLVPCNLHLVNNFFFKKEGFSKNLSNINLCVFINKSKRSDSHSRCNRDVQAF